MDLDYEARQTSLGAPSLRSLSCLHHDYKIGETMTHSGIAGIHKDRAELLTQQRLYHTLRPHRYARYYSLVWQRWSDNHDRSVASGVITEGQDVTGMLGLYHSVGIRKWGCPQWYPRPNGCPWLWPARPPCNATAHLIAVGPREFHQPIFEHRYPFWSIPQCAVYHAPRLLRSNINIAPHI